MSMRFARTTIAALLVLMASPWLAAAPSEVWLTAEDEVQIRGDVYLASDDDAKTRPVVLLFHQAGSNRGEYTTIAPRLNALGFHALAIDQRSGASRWGMDNQTVKKLGRSTSYLEALPDLEAALQWKKQSGFNGPTLVWGSSYSSSLVFLLAEKHGDQIDGVLSFSPGEYLGSRKHEVATAAAGVSGPVIILTPKDEESRAMPVFDAVAGEQKALIIPKRAVHGSSMLIGDRNAGATDIWPQVEKFLGQFVK
jgi:alpha-beta hydrolase superfamily lysophospholipase